MKLNIGCGKRVFKDYLNIDLDQRLNVDYPYLQSDAAKLPLDSECAEEILTVHIFEHFWPWDVQDILAEWKRVLKPGGMLIVECPNLERSAALFCWAIKEGKKDISTMLMNAFYGDPKDRDLPGRHKWGYTPQTLIETLQQAGFRECRQEPAQFKMKEPRDMRIVGVK